MSAQGRLGVKFSLAMGSAARRGGAFGMNPVVSDKREGWRGGFGFYACIVGREDCKEDTP